MRRFKLLGLFVIHAYDTGWITRELAGRNLALIVQFLPNNSLGRGTDVLAERLYKWRDKHQPREQGRAIARFYDNCKKGKPSKKGFPRFKKYQTHGSVEYKTSGWKLSSDRRTITFTDGFKAGSFKMWGTRDLHFYQLNQIKRVRVVRRADGYYVQFCLDVERNEWREPTGKTIGLDVGLTHFYTDSDGQTVENPRYLRKSERKLTPTWTPTVSDSKRLKESGQSEKSSESKTPQGK